jgi:hypothetical protein
MSNFATRAAILTMGATLVTLAVAGCAGTAIDTAATTASQPSDPPDPTDPAVPPRVGDTVGLRGDDAGESVQVTVLKVVDHARGADPELDTPPTGDHYYAVQFLIRNTGSTPYDDSPANGAKVIDIAGQIYNGSAEDDTTAGQSLPGHTIVAPGGSALGFLTFEVADHATIAKVQFGMDSGFSQTAQWAVP